MTRRAPEMHQVLDGDHVLQLAEGWTKRHRYLDRNYRGDCNNQLALLNEGSHLETVNSQGGSAIDQFIKSLRHRRATVQTRIADEQERSVSDQLRLTAVKWFRVRFRNQIEFIDGMNRQGETIAMPVVRCRSLHPLLAGKT